MSASHEKPEAGQKERREGEIRDTTCKYWITENAKIEITRQRTGSLERRKVWLLSFSKWEFTIGARGPLVRGVVLELYFAQI